MELSATVIVTTKNRREELRVALQSAFQQSASPEVLVIDDGSSDGTDYMVRQEFPKARLHRSEVSVGLIAQRNRAAQLATGDILFSIDDDAAFSTTQVVDQVLREFNHPRIEAVAIPYVEPRKDNVERQRAPSASGVWVSDAFIGTAHALRRDRFLELGGYREQLVHQGEERDLCIRLLAGGHVVRLGTSDPIQHFESPKRDYSRMDYYGRRNDIVFAWQNVPKPWLVVHLAGTTLNGLNSAFQAWRFRDMFHGVIRGYWDCFAGRHERVPVSAGVYQLNRRLKKAGPVLLRDIEALLPPLSQNQVSQR